VHSLCEATVLKTSGLPSRSHWAHPRKVSRPPSGAEIMHLGQK